MAGTLVQAARTRLMLTADSMAPPGLDAARRLQLERQMLDLLMRGTHQVLLTSAIVGPLLTLWLTLPHIGLAKAGLPALLLLAISVERVAFVRRAARERALNDDAPRQWANALAWRAALSGTIITVWCHFVIDTGDGILVSQVLALVTILSAGAAAQFCSWPPVMWATISPILLGMAGQLAVMSGPSRVIDAIFSFVLWLVLASASLRFARTLHREALTRLRNEDLVSELREKHAQAEAANAAKSQFFAAANHDLRQPLQALSLYLSMLQPPAGGASQSGGTLARIHQCMTALDHLLGALLDFSQMDSGQLTPMLRPFPLQPLLDRLASTYEAQARQKHLQLRVHPTSAWACTDPLLLERMLSNLLANALRYTSRGGVLLAAQRRGDVWRVCVVDTGVGIPDQAHEAIYQEFVQLGNAERDPLQGHGLGLATVRRIATLLKHPLGLRSRVGRGSVFTLDVPAANPGREPASPVSADTPVILRGRVLVVEDHALVRDALVQQLSRWGLDVQTATTGEAACAAMAQTAFDVVVCDWRLPGSTDGLQVLREARERLPQLKLGLLVTGEDEQRLHQFAPEFPVLRKPLRPLQLRTLLGRHLPGSVV